MPSLALAASTGAAKRHTHRRTGATGIPTAAMDGERSVGATIDKAPSRGVDGTPCRFLDPNVRNLLDEILLLLRNVGS